MFNFFQSKKPKEVKEFDSVDVVKTPTHLLSRDKTKTLISEINKNLNVTKEIWVQHYLKSIHNFAYLVQELPASQQHHHNTKNGLLDHTLEVVLHGLKLSKGYILPPNTKPELINKEAEKWRFAIFLTLLTHDLGKVSTDLDVEIFLEEKGWCKWVQWQDEADYVGKQYRYKFINKERSIYSKEAHKIASLLFLNKILTDRATHWLMSNNELMSQLLYSLSAEPRPSTVIEEILQKADMYSVKENIGSVTHDEQTRISNGGAALHEKIIITLREQIDSGTLKINKPGAALWVTEDYSWLVSKAGMESVRNELLNCGHKGIPNSVVQFFTILKDHRKIEENGSEAIWLAEVNDFQKQWKQKLTFLKFKNSVLFPYSKPELFDGTVSPQGGKTETALKNEPVKVIKSEKLVKHDKQSDEAKPNITKNTVENEFLNWLINGVQRKKIRVNEPKAPIHVLKNYIALVTPAIFNLYFKQNPIKKRVYETRCKDGRIFTLVQKELESLQIHKVGSNGQNIVDLDVEGDKSKSTLKVYLVHREALPVFNTFQANSVMKTEYV